MPPKARPKKSPSGIKRIRQAKKLTAKNKSVRSKVKTARKKVLAAVSAKDKAGAESALKEAMKTFGSAASKGVVHKNTASRNVSRLSKLVSKA